MKIEINIDIKSITIFCMIIATCFLLYALFKPMVLMVDHDQDIRYCKIGMSSKNYQPNQIDCFANDDYEIFNYGQNIHCNCFTDIDYTQHNFIVEGK